MMKTIGPSLGAEHDQKIRDIAIAEQENDMAREMTVDYELVKQGKREDLKPRSLRTIANEIRRDWVKVNYAALPYLQAMDNLNTVRDEYGCESARSIVLYFLSNATSWRGETARRIKAELKGML